MNLRLRLLLAFFLLSVVPLAAFTWYTYLNNAQAMRDAAGREAELLAGELSQRMQVVTAQLTQRVERLMTMSAAATTDSGAAATTPSTGARATSAPPAATVEQSAESAAAAAAADSAALAADQVSVALGEAAMLLNNIELRGLRGFGGRGERGRGAPPSGNIPPPEPGAPPDPDRRGGAPRRPEGAPGPAEFDPRGRDRGGRGDPREPGGPPGAPEGPPSAGTAAPPGRGGGASAAAEENGRIRIDLAPIRRELLQQLSPDGEIRRLDQLTPEERARIFAEVNQRMLGIQQGIQMLQSTVAERAAESQASGPGGPAGAGRESAGNARGAQAVIPEGAAVAGRSASARGDAPPAAPAAPAPPAPAPPEPPRQVQPTPAPASPVQRTSALSGSRLDVRLERDGEIVSQVNAEINLPNLLATVFSTSRRERGEVPFAIGTDGTLYTPRPEDKSEIERLGLAPTGGPLSSGAVVNGDWMVATAADPTGSGVTFAIARPVGEALQDLRRASARNAALGLGFIGLALVGMVPLSSRLTRNLSRLGEGVDRIAAGDYGARVQVHSRDEIGRLAQAFNRMAAEVEQHQRSAVEQERLRRELELGRQIQHDMLPQAPLRLGLTEIQGVSVPAREVGGDFFNYFRTSGGQIALLVGDVSGKGVGAALLMANLQASLRTRLSLGQTLAELAGELDTEVERSTPGPVYSTLFVGLLDPVTREFRYVNAGHNPQYLLRNTGQLERLDASGLPIGLLAGRGYEERRRQLAAGDLLFFYTDGCIESENTEDEMFGVERLESLLLSGTSGSADDVLVRIEAHIAHFRAGREPFDDATMMVVKVG
jgi:serine phosphatase RsbU (regulator of sigma subunit)